jgi:Leucine-rich repeat (LRR) protein
MVFIRYLVIMDDIWSIQAWKAISCALPQNGLGSRIIATTRNHDLARSCSSHPSDSIYEVKGLSRSESEILFHRRVYVGSEDKECREVRDQVLKICGGLPLSILVVASLLARTENLGKWEQYPLLQGTKKILHTSYTKLPFPVKSCFLYLSVFPKNYTINRDRLICRWIAEGFIPGSGEESTWETGRSYFNELINRSLVQPIFAEDEDDPVACTVHGAIHDFITSLSREENFVTLDEELIDSMPRDVIRRLSLNYTKQEDSRPRLALESGGIGLSRARSLTLLGPAQWMPPLSKFLLLRVLDLEDAEGLENGNLQGIGRLFNLKYLGLGGEHVTVLPESIGVLQSLETLDMRRTKVSKLPQAASGLKQLVRILAQDLDDIPGGVEEMQHLQKVTMLRVNSQPSIKLAANLATLGQLRSLGVKWCFRDDTGSKLEDLRNDFVSSLNKTSKSYITSLSIHSDEACSLGFLEKSWVPPYQLQKLVMKPSSPSNLPRIPEKIDSCQGITYLEITVNLHREDDILIISSLPALTILKLSARGKPIKISQGFGCLEVFSFQRLEDGLGLVFEANAMPLLRRLRLRFKLISQEQRQGCFKCLPHLRSLQHVIATIDCDGAKATGVVSLEEAIKQEIREHIKHPTLELSRDNEEKMVRDGAQGSTVWEVVD